MPALILLALKRLGGAVWGWLSSLTLWQLVSLGLAIILIIQHFQILDARHDRDAWRKQYNAEHQGRIADRKAYQQAQSDAKAKNLQTIAQVKSEQEKITNEVKSDLGAKLERLRRELRDNPAAKGSAGRTPIPETGPAPCRAYDPAWLCLSPADRLHAAENEQRHDSLIDWIERQSKVDPNTH